MAGVMGQAEQRIQGDRYQVVLRTLCFITHGGDVLLLRGAPDKQIWPHQYNGVGGHVKPDEDVRAAALREIREETGVAVRDLRLRGVISIPVDAGNGVLLFVFTAQATSRAICPSAEGQPEWIAVGEVRQLDLVEDLPILLPRVLSMGPDDTPFFALYAYSEDNGLVVVGPSTTA